MYGQAGQYYLIAKLKRWLVGWLRAGLVRSGFAAGLLLCFALFAKCNFNKCSAEAPCTAQAWNANLETKLCVGPLHQPEAVGSVSEFGKLVLDCTSCLCGGATASLLA